MISKLAISLSLKNLNFVKKSLFKRENESFEKVKFGNFIVISLKNHYRAKKKRKFENVLDFSPLNV